MTLMQAMAMKKRMGLVEAVYRGSIVIADANGGTLESFGDPCCVTFMRSASKPIQAMILAQTDAIKKFGLDSRHIAIASGSHNGQAIHTEVVLDMLSRAGLSEGDLCCGTHPPLSDAAKRELFGKTLTQVNHNCSGKHAAMLLACKSMGWDTHGYENPDHPVQGLILEIVSKVCGVSQNEIVIGIDGCSVPVFGMPILSMAQGFARLSRPELAPVELKKATALVNEAIRSHPLLIAGEDRIDTYLLQDNPDMVCKSGAEGVHCMGKDGVGLAFKIEAGEINDVLKAGVANCAQYLGGNAGEKLSAYLEQPIKTHNGQAIGSLEWTAKLS